MAQHNTGAEDPKVLELADEIIAVTGKHPRAVAFEALAQVVTLFCMMRSKEEARTGLQDFMSSAEQKRGVLDDVFACRSA